MEDIIRSIVDDLDEEIENILLERETIMWKKLHLRGRLLEYKCEAILALGRNWKVKHLISEDKTHKVLG